MNRDTEIRFQGQLFHGPAHIANEMNELIKSYPADEDPLVAECDLLKKIKSKIDPKIWAKAEKAALEE